MGTATRAGCTSIRTERVKMRKIIREVRDMSKTRVESFEDAINTINDNTYLNTENVRVLLLSEIAGSLAVIADYIMGKKDGDAE